MKKTKAVLATSFALVVVAVSANFATAARPGLKVRRARIKLGGAGSDQLVLRAKLRDPSVFTQFDPRTQQLDFFVNGREVLCVPGSVFFPDPIPDPEPDPQPEPKPDPGPYPDPIGRWTVIETDPGRWLYSTGTREVVLDLEHATLSIRCTDLDLGEALAAGSKDVRFSLQLGDGALETDADFNARPKVWKLAKR